MKVVPDAALTYSFYDVNVAYPTIHRIVNLCGTEEDTRNGPAVVMPVPVCITHNFPWRRVLFDPKRDANPFFHYMEAIWMLSGSNNIDFPAYFAKNIYNYSDDGITLHGAYGYRWFHSRGDANSEINQIETIIEMLKDTPSSRRLVVSMWDPALDLEVDSKDLPCNTQLYFRVVDGRLTMTVLNRSNDLVWGMLGANIVHMSILQEYVALTAGLQTGALYQFSNNVHIYKDWTGPDKVGHTDQWYEGRGAFQSLPFHDATLSLDEAARFVEDPSQTWEYWSDIIRLNALPMYEAYKAFKDGDLDLAHHIVQRIHDDDWRKACGEWIKRRMK